MSTPTVAPATDEMPPATRSAAAFLASAGLRREDVPSLLLAPPAASALESAMADTLVASTLEAFAQPWTR